MKLPYVTNGEGMRWGDAPAIQEFGMALNSHIKKYGDIIPYTMLQPRMENRKEYKLVFFNGEFQYFASINRYNVGEAFLKTKEQKEKCKLFASEAIKAFRLTYPFAILDGLVRVDVFRRIDGSYAVNEFESLDACTASAGVGGMDRQLRLRGKLIEYWTQKLTECIEKMK